MIDDSKKLATEKNPTIACITAYKMAGGRKKNLETKMKEICTATAFYLSVVSPA